MEDGSVMDASAIIEQWVSSGGVPTTDIEFRLIRRIPTLVERFDTVITDPIQRGLLGLSEPPELIGDLSDRLRISTSMIDSGALVSPNIAASLEEEAKASGDSHLWVIAARINALMNNSREAEARMNLAAQDLPYVFPGELSPLMVDVLACGECVLPALHVDWVRKVTAWLAPAIVMDCRVLGMWFWPVLRFLEQGKLVRPLAKLAKVSNMPPGGLGLAAVYSQRLGIPADLLLSEGVAMDKRVAALGILGDVRNG
jgi:hypothetical protein